LEDIKLEQIFTLNIISETPAPFEGIQVNFCKTPKCPNYGKSSKIFKRPRGRPSKREAARQGYILVAGEQATTDIVMHQCEICGEKFPIKSNLGIHEELIRLKQSITSFPDYKDISCSNPQCGNYLTVSIEGGTKFYYKHSKSKNGTARYKCKLCGTTFTASSKSNYTKKHKSSYKNRRLYDLLFSKTPFQRIMEYLDLAPQEFYNKIDFIYMQTLRFLRQREKSLLDKIRFRRLYVSADQQDLMLNWSQKDIRRNIVFKAAAAADNTTGYVFASFINHDPELDQVDIEVEAELNGDNNLKPPFRRFARMWLEKDYEKISLIAKTRLPKRIIQDLVSEIRNSYEFSESQEDIESSEVPSNITQLPHKGVQIHNEYTLYGMFFYLRELFSRTEKVRFYLDRDSGIRAACLAAFQKEIKKRTCDAFFLAINTTMTIDKKEDAVKEVAVLLSQMRKAYPGKTDSQIKLIVLKERLERMDKLGKWKDNWLHHPFPTIDEPEKRSCLITDYNDYDLDHLAWLHNKASQRGVNQWFMNVRRRISLLERPLSTPSNVGRKWYGYSAYSPEMVAKLLIIFRAYYNYCRLGQDDRTPAERIGLAKGPVRVEDIIYGKKFSGHTFQKLSEKNNKVAAMDATEKKKNKKTYKKRKGKDKNRLIAMRKFELVLKQFAGLTTVYLDIETTGADTTGKDKIIEIAIVDEFGHPLVNSLVNPQMPISEPAQFIHKITNKMVKNCPTFEEIEDRIVEVVRGKLVIMYGGESFDKLFLTKRIKDAMQSQCCMQWHASLCGEWNPDFGGFQWVGLASAAAQIGYKWQGKPHRALADALACRAVWNYLLTIKQ